MPTSDETRASISVVVPVYNSELILPTLVQRLEPVLTGVAHEYELVLVNDGSRGSKLENHSGTVWCHLGLRGMTESPTH